MDVLKFIDEIEDVILSSSSLPFSRKIMVDSEELLDIIREIRLTIPDEIKEAKSITGQKNKILRDAQKSADNILNDAESRLEELVEENGITKLAEERAQEIVIKAQDDAKEIRLGAMEYADDLLLNTQEGLKELIISINENRKELREED